MKKSDRLINLKNRPDIDYIVKLIPEGSRVLDLGCGNGELLYLLKQKKIKVQGIEKDEKCIYNCIEKGIYVYHGDIDDGLKHHIDKSFDYVILNQTIQETINPGDIIHECLRIGKHTIIVFPNFAHFTIRWQILLKGKTPVTTYMPYRWFETPNLHFISIIDFIEFCKLQKIKIVGKTFFSENKAIKIRPNFFSKLALFIIK